MHPCILQPASRKEIFSKNGHGKNAQENEKSPFLEANLLVTRPHLWKRNWIMTVLICVTSDGLGQKNGAERENGSKRSEITKPGVVMTWKNLNFFFLRRGSTVSGVARAAVSKIDLTKINIYLYNGKRPCLFSYVFIGIITIIAACNKYIVRNNHRRLAGH